MFFLIFEPLLVGILARWTNQDNYKLALLSEPFFRRLASPRLKRLRKYPVRVLGIVDQVNLQRLIVAAAYLNLFAI